MIPVSKRFLLFFFTSLHYLSCAGRVLPVEYVHQLGQPASDLPASTNRVKRIAKTLLPTQFDLLPVLKGYLGLKAAEAAKNLPFGPGRSWRSSSLPSNTPVTFAGCRSGCTLVAGTPPLAAAAAPCPTAALPPAAPPPCAPPPAQPPPSPVTGPCAPPPATPIPSAPPPVPPPPRPSNFAPPISTALRPCPPKPVTAIISPSSLPSANTLAGSIASQVASEMWPSMQAARAGGTSTSTSTGAGAGAGAGAGGVGSGEGTGASRQGPGTGSTVTQLVVNSQTAMVSGGGSVNQTNAQTQTAAASAPPSSQSVTQPAAGASTTAQAPCPAAPPVAPWKPPVLSCVKNCFPSPV